MKSLRLALLLLLTLGASGLRGQSIREEVLADPGKAGGIYYVYTYDNPVSTPAPAGYEPFYISHYGRHGSRWLLQNAEYADLKAAFDAAAAAGGLTDYGKDVARRVGLICADGTDLAGELSPLGSQQHRGIAERMYTAYPEVFRDSARIDARSTVVVRCVLSMASFCERLKELNPALKITRTANQRITRVFNFFNKAANPNLSDYYLGLPKSVAWSADAQQFRNSRLHPERLFGRIFTPEYTSEIQDPQRLMQLLGLARASLQGLELQVSLDDLFTPDELYGLWEYENYNLYKLRGGYPGNDRYPEYYARVAVEDILTRADRAIAQGTPAADLRFGHDANLMAMLNLMRVEGCTAVTADPEQFAESWPSHRISPMAANLQLIFFRKPGSGEVLVKLLHNEHEVRIPLPSDTVPYYRWSELKKFYRQVMDSIPAPADVH